MNSQAYHFDIEFQRALKFSDQVGFHVPKWNGSITPILESLEIKKSLDGLLVTILGESHDYKKLIFKCVQVHHEYRYEIANIIGIPPVFTIGCIVDAKNQERFSITEDEVTAWLNKGYENRTKYKMHAWLTLPSLEIIDFTLSPTLSATDNGDGLEMDSSIMVIARHWSQTPFIYKPVAMGNDIPCKFGLGF